jgi:hypothetical protein
MTVINDQKQGHRPRGARGGASCDLVPVRCEQACRDSLPIAAGSRLRVFLLTSQLAGGFAASRLFPHSSLRSGLLLPSMREGDRLRSLPLVAGRHKFRSPRVGVRRGGCAFVAAPTSRLHFKPTNHVCQDNSDWSESHRSLSVAAVSMAQPSERTPRDVGPFIQGRGND